MPIIISDQRLEQHDTNDGFGIDRVDHRAGSARVFWGIDNACENVWLVRIFKASIRGTNLSSIRIFHKGFDIFQKKSGHRVIYGKSAGLRLNRSLAGVAVDIAEGCR